MEYKIKYKRIRKKKICNCGLIITEDYFSVHIKTNKHILLLKKKEDKIKQNNILKKIYPDIFKQKEKNNKDNFIIIFE